MTITPVPLPIASYQLPDLRAGAKRLVNCFPTIPSQTPEPDDTKDQQQLVTLRRWPGITTLSSYGGASGGIRGIWEMAGTIYVVIGSVLATLSAGGVFTPLNGATPIPGVGFVRMTDNTACLVILVPGTDSCYTYTPFTGGGGFQPLSNSFFLNLGGAIDCWFVDSFIVFLANNNPSGGPGSLTFFNDDGKQVSGNAQITFTTAASFTREFGTDPFYGLCVDHREVLAFGSRTTEGYVNTGNATGTPFSTAPDTYMPYGMHPSASFTIALQDNSVFWVANDLTVRRREGQTPVRVSDEGIENILQTAAAGNLLVGAYAMAPSFAGAPLYVLTIPLMQRTLVYNCVTQKWFELSSFIGGVQQQWRAQVFYNGFGLQLIGDAQGPNIGYLDQDASVEFGSSPVVCMFMTQPIFDRNTLLTIWRVEAVMTAGAAAVGSNAPSIQLLLSDNWGQTFYAFDDESQTLGVPGDTDNRAVWFELGQHRSLVAQFRVSDPSPLFTVTVTADVDEGMAGY